MDLYAIYKLHAGGFRFSSRIQKLQVYIRNKFSTGRKALSAYQPWLLLAASVSLGFLAHAQSEKKAVAFWLETHSPSKSTWAVTLRSLGYVSPNETPYLSKALRTLPASWDEAGSAWITEDHNWISVAFPQNSLNPFEIYCLNCKEPPVRWQPKGKGWAGFEVLLELATRASQKLKDQVKVPKPTRHFDLDPREIRY